MENAAKALLMAGGILIGVLILALMVTLFESSRNLSDSYETTKKQEAIQQFNTNFTKYLGQDITIHDVLTIYNFANEQGTVITEKSGSFSLDSNQISIDVEAARTKYNNDYSGQEVKVEYIYKFEIQEYNDDGLVTKIKFSNRRLNVTPLS